jgi:hypothetical protein
MKTDSIKFSIKCDIDYPEEFVEAMIEDVCNFIDVNFSHLAEDATVDRFTQFCADRGYPIDAATDVSYQCMSQMFGQDFMTRMANDGYAKNPTIN